MRAFRCDGVPAALNSDQGSQFTSEEYKNLLKELHIRQSMDGKSRWADNIMIERWFHSLKTELIYINEYRSCPADSGILRNGSESPSDAPATDRVSARSPCDTYESEYEWELCQTTAQILRLQIQQI